MDCAVNVHEMCYGVEESSQKWKCSLCKSGKNKFACCQLCLKKGGAMKETVCKKWAHIICALFTPGVVFTNEETMEPIDISKISSSMRNKCCSICFSSQGYACYCAFKKCKNRLHITCGKEKSTLKEVVDPENDKISFRAYCKDHKPDESSRRLSSESIKGAMEKKKAIKMKKQSASDDSLWLLNQPKCYSTPAKPAKKRSRKSQFLF